MEKAIQRKTLWVDVHLFEEMILVILWGFSPTRLHSNPPSSASHPAGELLTKITVIDR